MNRGTLTINPGRETRERVQAQADQIAQLLGVDEEEVGCDPRRGVILTPAQADQLLQLVRDLA